MPELDLIRRGLRYTPVSRFYPTPPVDNIRPQKTFVRPVDAPLLWWHMCVEHASLPSSPTLTADPATTRLLAQVLEQAWNSGLIPLASEPVRETIERALVGLAFSDLEWHSSAASRQLPDVRLSEDASGQLSISPDGKAWNVKGRGPVYSGNSAVIDCVIIVGKLLEAGSTNADRKKVYWYDGCAI
ncbi:hypothetical protein BDV12DRAFT_197769 [Aspergillus spectabilis]